MKICGLLRNVEGGVEINITVSPNSDAQGIGGTNEWRKRLIVRVRSPPLDGKANREVEELMERRTGCRCEIIKGHTDRQKTIMIYGDPDEITRSLEASE
jgi:uncharacterized protein (TIGR00251 family)